MLKDPGGLYAPGWLYHRMEQQESLAGEHSVEYKAALQRAVALDIPVAYSPSQYETFNEGEASGVSSEQTSFLSSKKRKESWDKFVGRLFDAVESGQTVFKRPV